MGYRLNRLDELVFIAVSKPLLIELGFYHRLESCVGFLKSYYKTLVLLVGFSPGLKEGLIGQEHDEIKSSMRNICMIIIR